jgi:hypothetical protein
MKLLLTSDPGAPLTRRAAALVAPLALLALSACGGGGGSSAPVETPPPDPGASTPAAPVVWLSSAAQLSLVGDADSGIEGPLLTLDPAQPNAPLRPTPGSVDSTSQRVVGGKVDATLSQLDGAAPRTVVYDAAVGGGVNAFGLYQLALELPAATTPVARRVSSAQAICYANGQRFRIIGQNLAGTDAVIGFSVPDASGSCVGGGLPRLASLRMGSNEPPIEVSQTVAERITPIGPIHGSSGQIAAFLAWQNGRYVRTDALLGNPVPIADADIAGTVDPLASPLAPGIVTRFGIFVRAADGLRRYDKSTGRLSAPLVIGQVASGAGFNEFHDEQALYITTAQPDGAIDLYRIEDTLAPVALKLNIEGPLAPYGFRVLKSQVLYALEGSTDHVAWRKSDGQRSRVLDARNVVVASTLSDRVFHERFGPAGEIVLASSRFDGSEERVLGPVRLLSRSMAAQMTPFARNIRDNGAFGHVLVLVPADTGGSLSGATARWISFDAAAGDVDAGTLPTTAGLGSSVEAPGIVADAALLSVARTGAVPALYVVRRASGSLAAVGGN